MKKTILSSILFLATATFAAPPVLSPPGPTYEALRSAWVKGEKTSEEFLKGTWHVVVSRPSASCARFRSSFYSPSGRKMSEKSFYRYEFVMQSRGSEIVDGIRKEDLVVHIFNLEQEDVYQGPYLVDPTEPKFSYYAYSYTPILEKLIIDENKYTEVSCRKVADRQDKMVCLEKTVLVGESQFSSEMKACAKENIASIIGLTRVIK